jgi:hypothetical protein
MSLVLDSRWFLMLYPYLEILFPERLISAMCVFFASVVFRM